MSLSDDAHDPLCLRPLRGHLPTEDGGEERCATLPAMPAKTLTLYIDYKSPYAYLAKEPAYRLERETGAAIDWLPYILDIPAYLGSAKVDAEGRVLEQDRNAHQWRRVKYSYMDVRREANRVGLTIRGTRKIWNSSLAGIGCCTPSGTASSAPTTTKSSSGSGSTTSTSRILPRSPTC